MDDNSTDSPSLTADVNAQIGGRIMLFSIVSVMGVITFILCFHFYARFYSRHISRRSAVSASGARHVTIDIPTVFHRGLLPSLIKLIPTFVYSSVDHHRGLECAVCLSEFEDGEKGRVLPDCRHCFHVECIDVWFKSHSNCPLCRAPVKPMAHEVGSDKVLVPMGHDVGSVAALMVPVECRVKSGSSVLIVSITDPNPV